MSGDAQTGRCFGDALLARHLVLWKRNRSVASAARTEGGPLGLLILLSLLDPWCGIGKMPVLGVKGATAGQANSGTLRVEWHLLQAEFNCSGKHCQAHITVK